MTDYYILIAIGSLGAVLIAWARAKVNQRDAEALDNVVEAMKRDSAAVLLDLERQMVARLREQSEHAEALAGTRVLTPEEQGLWDTGTEYLDSKDGREHWPRPEVVELADYLHHINYRNVDAQNLAADILQHLREKKTTP